MQNTQERYIMACPMNGKLCCEGNREDFPKRADGLATKCRWWVHLFGKDPQSERILDQFDCAIAWLPTTTVEGAQMTRQATASIDSMRNIFSGLVRPRPAPEIQAESPPPAIGNGNAE